MAKRIRVSSDDVTYYTLPGNSGEMTDEAGQIVDTIFGQSFESQQTGIIGWNIQANALYRGFAGYVATLKKVGASATSATGEAMTLLTGKRYQINDASKQIWDRNATITVYDNAVDQTANVITFDYLNGIIEFDAAYTVTSPVTIDVDYFTTAAIGRGKSFTLNQTTDAIDDTDFPTAQGNSGHRTFTPDGLRRVTLEIGGIYDTANGFRAALVNREVIIIEIAPSGALTGSYCRGYFQYAGRSQSGDVGALEEETANFNLNVPDEDTLETPFKWVHPGTTTLNPAVQVVLTAWQDQAEMYTQYLPDGTNGFKGACVVTDATLTGGLEVMNEFSVQLQGSDQVTVVP